MAHVIDTRPAGGDFVIIGQTLVLPNSNVAVVVGAEPITASVRYNPDRKVTRDDNGVEVPGALEAYLPIPGKPADWKWERIGVDRDTALVMYTSGATMSGDLVMRGPDGAYRPQILLERGSEQLPGLAFDKDTSTGLYLDIDDTLRTSVAGTNVLVANSISLTVQTDLYATNAFFETVWATTGNIKHVFSETVLSGDVTTDTLTANLGTVHHLISNLVDVVPVQGDDPDAITEFLMTVRSQTWKTTHNLDHTLVTDFMGRAILTMTDDGKVTIDDTLTVENLHTKNFDTENLQAKNAQIDTLYANNVTVANTTTTQNLRAQSALIDLGTITTLFSTDATITNLAASNGTVVTLTSTDGQITHLKADDGTITDLASANASINTLASVNGTITSLNSSNAAILSLTGGDATFDTLTASNGTVRNLSSTSGRILKLDSALAAITGLSATDATVANAVTAANVAVANSLVAGDLVQAQRLISQVALISNLTAQDGTFGNSVNTATLVVNAAVIGTTWGVSLANTSLVFSGNTANSANALVFGSNGTIRAVSFEASNTDTSSRYHADDSYEPGTVLIIGGDNEVTVTSTPTDTRVAGVVSERSGYKLNADSGFDATHPYIALNGRVPCKVIAPVQKGDVLVTSSLPGYAMAASDPSNVPAAAIIGKALGEMTAAATGYVLIKV